MAKDPSIQEKSKRPSSRREQSVALGTGAIFKRRATEMETGEGGSEDGNAVGQVRKKRKDDFEDKVREAQKINNDDFTPLVATHKEWREVLKLTQERYRDETARKDVIKMGMRLGMPWLQDWRTMPRRRRRCSRSAQSLGILAPTVCGKI